MKAKTMSYTKLEELTDKMLANKSDIMKTKIGIHILAQVLAIDFDAPSTFVFMCEKLKNETLDLMQHHSFMHVMDFSTKTNQEDGE